MIISPRNYTPTNHQPPFFLPSPGISNESALLARAFVNEAILALNISAGHSEAMVYTYSEQLHQYNRPAPKRSYKMKIHIIGKRRGKPIDFGYEEGC